jgi:hypothetical protein
VELGLTRELRMTASLMDRLASNFSGVQAKATESEGDPCRALIEGSESRLKAHPGSD